MTHQDTNCLYTRLDPDNPPPPLMTGAAGSFAHHTIAVRKPAILQNVLADFSGRYPPEIEAAVRSLHEEMTSGHPIRPLETTAPDGPAWAAAWQRYRGRTWLDVPWYFAEVFFYRRLMEAAGYFSRTQWAGVDPFRPRKEAELAGETPWQLLALALEQAGQGSAEGFEALLHHGLWGNRVDLSHIKLAQSVGGHLVLEDEKAHLVVDDTGAVVAHVSHRPAGARFDFICDNAGTELLMDLAMADFLLRFGWAGAVTMHVKGHPTFVSDTTPADVAQTVAAMKARPEAALRQMAGRLEENQAAGRLRLRPDFYWNSVYFFWEMPPEIEAELNRATLVFIKGDANYRRLLGDSRCWPVTISAAEAVAYFPAPFVALRTLKSEPIIGLKPGQAELLDRQDSEWRVNGRRGVIQFANPTGEER